MQKYELLYIVPTQYTDAEVETTMKKVGGMIEQAAGKVLRNENLGKIKLAYPIKKVRHGSYVLVQFEVEPKAIQDLERQLRLTDEVLRHQVVVLDKEAEGKTFQLTSYVAPLSEEAKTEEGSRPAPTRAAAPAAAPAPTAAPVKREDSNLSIEELDKKLDEILEADVTKDV